MYGKEQEIGMLPQNMEEASGLVQRWAEEFLNGPDNDLGRPDGPREAAFGPPLTGFAAGYDPLWAEFKKVVDPGHWSPKEAFDLAFPDSGAPAEELSVIALVLPQTEATLKEQRARRDFPGERWARSRWHGQPRVVNGLAAHLTERLRAAGLEAVAPDSLPEWRDFAGGPFLYSSNWSHRHAAYTAGLGTFGLCDGLITPLGKAVRLSSLVVRAPFPAAKRDYEGPYDYCLFFNSGICGKCIKRCPAGAIGPRGHDKSLCRPYIYEKSIPFITAHWPDISGAYGCGLCQAGVPCESRIPPRKRLS
jgi:Uncharacterized Fe-S protein